MKIAIFSVSGDQGLAQVRRAIESGHTPIAISRNPGRSCPTDGTILRSADYGDHESLKKAIEGADVVLLNLPSTSFQSAEPLIEATKVIANSATGNPTAKLLVFNTSMPLPNKMMDIAAQDARLKMREIILASEIPAIVIQPVVYLDNLLKAWAWPEIRKSHLIHYPHREDLEVSWLCHDDLAKLMIAAAERPQLSGRIFSVGGPAFIRGPELARRLGGVWNMPLQFKPMSLEEFGARMADVFAKKTSLDSATLAREMTKKYAWYNDPVDRPFRVDMGPVLKELSVTLTSLEDWASQQTLPKI